MAELWARGLLPAVLDVQTGDRPAGGASVVSVRYRSRGARLGQALCWTVLAGRVALAWFLSGDESLLSSYDETLGAMQVPVTAAIVSLILIRSRTRRIFLTDQILGNAAARAAAVLGRTRGPGRWRARGGAAGRIGADLARLHRLWTPTSHGYLDPGRERALLQQAGPDLRAFMQLGLVSSAPADRFAEPDHLDPAPYQAGGAWPTLSHHATGASPRSPLTPE